MTLRRLLLTFAIVFVPVFVAAAPCPLPISSAITHTPIPLHRPLQGKTVYNDPTEWPGTSDQFQWALNGAVVDPNLFNSDGSVNLLSPSIGHFHAVEACFPRDGVITGPITIPWQIMLFRENTSHLIENLQGVLVRDVVWDTVFSPMADLIVAQGHLTLDPFMVPPESDNSNTRSAQWNGWTIFQIGAGLAQDNGDELHTGSSFSLWTALDTTKPTNPLNGAQTGAYNWVHAARDANGGLFGASLVVFGDDPLPVLAPFTGRWNIPSMNIASYGGHSSIISGEIREMRCGLNLHMGIVGHHLNFDGSYIDANEIAAACGTGVQKIAWLGTTTSGPNGIPGIAAPNEVFISLHVETVEVGDGSTPPPPPGPQNCVVGSWSALSSTTTDTPAVTAGATQTRTETTVIQEQRPILTPAANGGTGCPIN